MSSPVIKINPKMDLVIERVLEVPVDLVWEAWTTPAHLEQWFCPKPWKAVDWEIDLRPGGISKNVMKGPNGESVVNSGCYLEVEKNKKLVWTSALQAGFRPAPKIESGFDMPFTGAILMEGKGSSTKYTAIAIHRNEAEKQTHEKMGFYEGWGTTIDQLVELMKKKK